MTVVKERPRVSVCMAAYNGSRFIAVQVASILLQLEARDELVIVDDHSQDDTPTIVKSFLDSRVRLIRNERNCGIARSFEKALALATGRVVFLSDQDDVWMEGKVKKVLSTFERYPDVDLVTSDAILINENGTLLGPSYYKVRGKFRPGFLSNLVRCKYLGSTMAFRSCLLSKAMPFPSGNAVLHDLWIGVINALSRGRAFHLEEPLVKYRRHAATATGRKLGVKRQLDIRFQLVKAVANYWMKTF